MAVDRSHLKNRGNSIAGYAVQRNRFRSSEALTSKLITDRRSVQRVSRGETLASNNFAPVHCFLLRPATEFIVG